MSRKFRIGYFAHSLSSDWNNGNAHFLRGLLRSMGDLGHHTTVYEAEDEWSIMNLKAEELGQESLSQFARTYPDLCIVRYRIADRNLLEWWAKALRETELVIVHEWNNEELVHNLLELRERLGFRIVFHDTHHRAASSPQQIERFQIHRFDGVIAFGEVLSEIYRTSFGISRVWTLHEAADTTVFQPKSPAVKTEDGVWIGNWGDEERSEEICEFLLRPAAQLHGRQFTVYGVRYPEAGRCALRQAGVRYGGYLPNLAAPWIYSSARLTVHIPRRQYATCMPGIPTIRVFEALACGIPLISAPWEDSEQLFGEEDFCMVRTGGEMKSAMETLLNDTKRSEEQAARGRKAVLARHTCRHRAEQLTSYCEELFR